MIIPRIHAHPDAECASRRQFWKENRWLVDWVEGETEEILKSKSTDLILLPPEKSDEWLKKFSVHPMGVSSAGFVDSAWLEGQKYYPRNIQFEITRSFIVKISRALDIKKICYIAGTGAWARNCAAIAFSLGYRNMVLVDVDMDLALENKKRIEKFCFPIELKVVEHQGLTLEPNNGSMLFSSGDLEANPDFLETLLYLNFIHHPGLIIDTWYSSKLSPLLEEGTHTGFEVVSGTDLRGLYDFHLLHEAKVQVGISWKAYLLTWRAFLGFFK